MRRVLLAVLVAWPVASQAAPVVTVAPELGAGLERLAQDAWRQCERLFATQTGIAARAPLAALSIRVDPTLPPGHAGGASPGVIGVRQRRVGHVDEQLAMAVRHEVAHQFLWSACPAGSRDRLFHEAFALAASGEVPLWEAQGYLSLPEAARTLQRARSLDVPSSRRALARVLVETSGGAGLPSAVGRRLQRCADGAAWGPPMTVDELTTVATRPAEAFVVISRHSGEVLASSGAIHQPMPFGSTLKPFLVAGAQKTPTLRPQKTPQWACGDDLPATMAADTALLRSCNGWFLDWEKQEAKASSFGAFGPALVKLGLARLPRDMAEATGLRATLAMSPLSLATAYRLLGQARPELIKVLSRNSEEGTLAGLDSSASWKGVALKTGTVRDERSAVTVGWIVAVDADVIAVMAQPGRAPRTFAGELLRRWRSLPHRDVQVSAAVQVFGLLEPSSVEVRCRGRGFAVGARAIEPLGTGWLSLPPALRSGELVCADGPWSVRFPGEPGRDYAGVFRRDVAPAYRPARGERVGGRTLRARRGSDVVFTTTLSRYVAGVVQAEDATLTGGAREAVARVIAHNVRHSRHEGRPVCDTTHCQTFKGTVAADAVLSSRMTREVPGATGWLHFSQGGDEPWQAQRPLSAVEGVLGRGATAIGFGEGRVRWIRQGGDASMPYDEPRSAPCESLRGPLKLPSCPDRVVLEGATAAFFGRGRGHGEGLDVEAAKASGAEADELLRRAYPR